MRFGRGEYESKYFVTRDSCDSISGVTRDLLLRLPSRRERSLSREAVKNEQQCSYTRSGASMSGREAGNSGVVRRRALDICGQAIKGAWGMSWRQKTMTGVEDCEKFGVVVKQTLIPKFPNQPALNP